MGLRGKSGFAITLSAMLLANCAQAQDNLELGKSAAQLFASDCSICHKSPQGLAKGGGLFGVQSFLRQHYTTSKESAAAMAAYLEAVDRAAGPAQRGAKPPKRAARGETGGKPAAKKPEAKPGEGESDKASGAKSGAKPSEPKAAETKPAESKPAAPKTEAKPSEPKPSESKPAEAPKADKSE